jgi:HEAT repeat protein
MLGAGWAVWVLTGAAAYLVVRAAVLTADVARAVRVEPPARPPPPSVWPLPSGLALGAAAVAAVYLLLDDPQLRRRVASPAGVVGFFAGLIADLAVTIGCQMRVVPRQVARRLSESVEELQTGDAAARERAVRLMARMGPHAAPAADPLADAARRDPSPAVRALAWEVLSDLSDGGPPVPDDLVRAGLADPDVRVRTMAARHVARSLTGFGRPGVRRMAGYAPEPPAAPPPPEVLAILSEAVTLPDDVTAVAAAGSAEPDPPLGLLAAEALADLGPFAAPAVPALRAAVLDCTPPRYAAVEALGAVGPAAVPVLAELLTHPDPEVRITAVTALGEIGPPARDAVPALWALAAAHPDDAPFAEHVIDQIGGANPGTGSRSP